jgi:ubiquinone/menaquinone biosynthesis C-methylase UbiE
MRTYRLPLLFTFALALLAASVGAQAQKVDKKLDVPYVATPTIIVDQMLKMAGVSRKDVLYDLGSGDGRIVITAARRFGTQGVGVDIDPERIREAQQNAKEAGVTRRVRFLQQDLFETDISEATVVTLYLLPAINLKLKPKLLTELKPGTRVVSHNYDMGDDWKPEKTVETMVEGTRHTIYFWVVPQRL